MRSDEKTRFVQVLAACLDAYGRERSDAVMALWWKLLQPYQTDQVEDALANHMRTSRFAPVPADIIGQLQAKDGRPTAEEAWAMVPRSEYESVFWTEEMAQSYGIASPLLQHGDQVAARKAFIDRYESLVAKARASGEPMKVTPSFGFDVAGLEAAVQKAVERGLLPIAKARFYIEHKATVEALGWAAQTIKSIQ
jgi:hypothetical protein